MANSLLRAVLIAALCFVALVVGEAQSREAGAAEPRSRGANDPNPDKASIMRECDEHITECGVMDATKVVTKPASTIRIQTTVTKEIVKRLPDITNVITKVDVTTINDKIQGHCRNTTVYIDPKPAIVTEYVTVEHVKELVSIVNTTTVVTSTVTGKTIEQCFINNKTIFPEIRSTVTSDEVPLASKVNDPAVGLVEDNDRKTAPEHAFVEKKHSESPPRDGFLQDFTDNYMGAMDL